MNEIKLEQQELDITINLGQGESTKALPAKELVQFRHYQSLLKQIGIHLQSPLVSGFTPDEKHAYGSGWTQFIDGSRGAGKSTFLHSVKGALEADANLSKEIAFFDIIDPSRIEQSEIPLLIILQALGKQVDAALVSRLHLDDGRLREDWRRAFSGVAGGLSLFAKDYHPLNDLDPELFLDWGLERTRDSVRLRENLHKLFYIACRILNVKALILGFDDADTDSTLAIPLLECIRKYLDTPRIMVLVTGDLELYSLLIRQKFAGSITGRPEAAIELQRSSRKGDRSAQYLKMIDHLEEQYLLKLFPILRRIHLQPLWNAMLRDKYSMTYTAWGENKLLLTEAIDYLIKHGLRVKSNTDINLYTEFLLKQPLRTVFQVLERCAPYLGKLIFEKPDERPWSRELTLELSRSLQALALTSLYKLSVDTDALAAKEISALIQAVFYLSLLDGDLDTAPYLRPVSADDDIRTCFAALAGEIPNFCAKEPGRALRYLLRGPGSVSLFSQAQPQINTRDIDSQEAVDRFTSYMGVGRKEDSLDWARRATAVIALPLVGNYTGRIVLPGVVGLRRKARAGEVTATAVIKDAVVRNKLPFPTFALGILNVVGDSSPRTYGSIFAILGLIEKLLTAGADHIDVAKTIFDRAYPPVTVSAPTWSLRGASEIDVEENSDDNESDLHILSSQADLWAHIEKWLIDIRDVTSMIIPSGIFLGKIWTRSYFSLQNAAVNLKGASFATLMEIFAACILNAFLIEEAEHHMHDNTQPSTGSLKVDRNNPRKSADFFVRKLENLRPERSSFPFTAVMATCPLMLGLLDSRKGYSDALTSLFPSETDLDYIERMLCPDDLFALIENVSVAGGGSDNPEPDDIRTRRRTSRVKSETSDGKLE